MKITGADQLVGALKKAANLDDVKNTIKLNTSEMNGKMVRRASFKGHYQGSRFVKPTGATKRSIQPEFRDKGFTGVTGPQTEYAPYLIYGTRYMESQDFFRPAFKETERQFIRDMQRLMK